MSPQATNALLNYGRDIARLMEGALEYLSPGPNMSTISVLDID